MLERTHSLAACILIIGPTRITEFGESDAIRFSRNADSVTPSVSADGKVTYNASNDQSWMVSITLKQTSFAYRILASLVQAQELSMRTVGVIPPVPISFSNPATGDLFTGVGPVFLNMPEMLANKDAGEVTFRLSVATAQAIFGAIITPQVF